MSRAAIPAIESVVLDAQAESQRATRPKGDSTTQAKRLARDGDLGVPDDRMVTGGKAAGSVSGVLVEIECLELCLPRPSCGIHYALNPVGGWP